MDFYDLFGGIGGFRIGLERKGHNCVGYCDINKWASGIYSFRFQEENNPTDVRRINATRLPNFDLLCAGFPCQTFSYAGKRKGFEGCSGTLFYEIARVIGIKKPPYILLENVRGLLSNNKRKTFKIILETFWKLGYNVQWMLLNSKYYGVPQNRERIFIIANLREYPTPSTINARPYQNNPEEISETGLLMAWYGNTGGNIKQRIKNADKYSSWCVGGSDTVLVTRDYRYRKLSMVEYERLQGFPDNWTKFALINGKVEQVAVTIRKSLIANAVTVNVIENIAEIFIE